MRRRKWDKGEYKYSNANCGTISGGGIYTVGQEVVLTADPDKNHDFVGWYTELSKNNPPSGFIGLGDYADGVYTLTFTHDAEDGQTITIYAIFKQKNH